MKRQIIKINEEKCNGCGQCITGCPEGAIAIINGKAKLAGDIYCDGLGACTGNCPENAITIEEREAAPYDEALVMEGIIKQGKDVIAAHLKHLRDHDETEYFNEAIKILKDKGIAFEELIHKPAVNLNSCPGSVSRALNRIQEPSLSTVPEFSMLNQWPVKLKLLSPESPVFKKDKIDLLVSADCAPYACGRFHEDYLGGKVMVTFCPKLDPYIDEYREKLAVILSNINISSVTIARMEVPCCGGVTSLVKEAAGKSGTNLKILEKIIKI